MGRPTDYGRNSLLTRSSWTSGGAHRSELVSTSRGATLMQVEAGPFLLTHSAAGHQAHDPYSDTLLHQVDEKQAFAVVLNSDFTARGASYLSRNLIREVQTQVQAVQGDLAKAFLAAISSLDVAFRRIHPFNGPVLEGVRVAAAYLSASTNTVHLASNGGGSFCTVGRSLPNGGFAPLATVGSLDDASSDPAACRVQQVQLDRHVDTIIIGSPGLWREVSPDRAVLRVGQYHRSIPAANAGNAAGHLVNHALHSVTERLRPSNDPRMRSLQSVQHLQSLWVGDRSNFKHGHRQPVRRRRGDVHGDISAAVFHLQWHGDLNDLDNPLPCKLRHSASTPALAAWTPQRPNAQARWKHVRLHFVDFPRQACQHLHQKWLQVIAAALDQHRQGLSKDAAAKHDKRNGITIRASSHDTDARGTSFVSVSA